MNTLYTAEQLASMLQVHVKTIYRLRREGKLKYVRVGRAVRFPMPIEEVRHDTGR